MTPGELQEDGEDELGPARDSKERAERCIVAEKEGAALSSIKNDPEGNVQRKEGRWAECATVVKKDGRGDGYSLDAGKSRRGQGCCSPHRGAVDKQRKTGKFNCHQSHSTGLDD